MNFLKIITILATSSFALKDAHGNDDVLSKIRNRPAFSQNYSDDVMALRNTRTRPESIEYYNKRQEACPKAQILVKTIFESLIERNNLASFVTGAFGAEIAANCYAKIGRSTAGRSGVIEISGSDLKAITTIDEAAFIVAHELSHLLLAHDEAIVAIVQGLVVNGLDFRTMELEADHLALSLLANAGFDFSQGANALLRIMRAQGECFGPLIYCHGLNKNNSERVNQLKSVSVKKSKQLNLLKLSTLLNEVKIESEQIK